MDQSSLTWKVTPDLLGVFDAGGKFMGTNPAWHATLGRTAEDIESHTVFDFIHPEDLARTATAFVDVRQGKPDLGFENRYRHKDGSYRWLSWNLVPEGDICVCSARAVTPAKNDAAALVKSNEIGELRERFISVLGHDLRNPLAGALCAIQYLERETLSERSETVRKTASDALQRMSKLIDDSLDFARTRLGGDMGADIRSNTFLRPHLEHAVAEIRMANPELKLEEIYAFQDPVACDAHRIAQLLSNLLGNAVFHGDGTGAIRVHAQDINAHLMISVTNKGNTISQDSRAQLFEPFQRPEPGGSLNGLGLGLYIVKQIARCHNGDMEVASANGETTFTLKFPRDAATPSDPAEQAADTQMSEAMEHSNMPNPTNGSERHIA